MIISGLLAIALLVGSFLYWNELSSKVVRTYWSLFLGSFLLAFIISGPFILIIQIGLTASFFAHAKFKGSGHL